MNPPDIFDYYDVIKQEFDLVSYLRDDSDYQRIHDHDITARLHKLTKPVLTRIRRPRKDWRQSPWYTDYVIDSIGLYSTSSRAFEVMVNHRRKIL